MTCYVDPETGDVYDPEGAVVGNLVDSHEWTFSWAGEFPQEALDVLHSAMDGDQPSSYNQAILGDMAAENIEMGTPP